MTDRLWCADLGDGTYQNPVLLCDYSDPDVIRVGDTYYMTASSFNYTPGLPILVSRDLVNWTLRNYALPVIPEPRYDAPQHAQGVWAPAIRHHNGRFYIYYGMPDEGIYMVSAEDALGAWDAPVCVLPGKGLIDPCPFWDDDGRAYVVHGYAKSRIGFKSILGIFPMSPDGTRAIGEDHFLFDGRKDHPTMEGPKVHKRDGMYYIFAPAGGVATGWQVCLRSRNIMGPYEDRVVLKQGSSPVNGPHQGAWVDTPAGEHWFFHFQSRGLYGRVVHMQPMTWQEDGWPFIGQVDPSPVDPASIACGEDCEAASYAANAADCGIPVLRYKKPAAPVCEITSQQGSDDFTDRLGMQWQFMGNMQDDFGSLSETRQCLKLAARLPVKDGNLWNCPHVMTQKIACPAFTATVRLDALALASGARAGLGMVGGQYAYVAVERQGGAYRLLYVQSEGKAHEEHVLCEAEAAQQTTLRVTLTPEGTHFACAQFAYSLDGEAFTDISAPWSPARHTWVGARLALFAIGEGGHAHFGALDVQPTEET